MAETRSREQHIKDIDIGSRLRIARHAQRLSQRELARKSGVTNGMISQIEQNQSSPSISSLTRILDAIPMTLSEFFAEDFDASPKVFFKASELREINLTRMLPLGSADAEISLRQVGETSRHALQMLFERYAPGADTGAEMYSHNGEEAGIVISGRIEITVGTLKEIVEAGGAYIFDSRIPHRFRNTGDEECVIVSACTPPTF